MFRCIYKIINVVNNKFYVGSAVHFSRRKSSHLSKLKKGTHINKHLQAAWNKYGEKAFVFVVVESVPDDADLLAAENIWLKEHVGKDYCYNIALDACAPQLGKYGEQNSMWGKTFKHTEEAKERIRAASKARVQSEEEKRKRRETMKGHVVSTETRLKLSASLSGPNNPWYGKKRPDHAKKISKPIIAIKPNGEKIQYDSIAIAREALHLKPPTIARALKSNKPITRGKFVGWWFQYA